ncbi:organic solute transporter Ostalpha-domain-containing protein [Nemania sp. FL0916]|nr:organic solute transporter Ostalpha-domain-containing protein [Nemania sp. FL0916]
MGKIFNSTCPLPKDEIEGGPAELPIVGNLTFQNLLLYISLAFTGITLLSSLSIAISHLCCYVRPREQRQIIRILFYPVVLAVLSSLSILSYSAYQYLWPAEGLYEPISLAAIFFLFVEFAAPDASTREEYFNELEAKRQKKGGDRFGLKKAWTMVPGGSLRWFQSKYVALYIYFIATIVIKIVQEITQALGRYCQYSFSPAFAHIWVIVISYVALPIGVLAILQFYLRMNTEPHFKARKPTLKILSFKAVILITFVQEIIFDILVSTQAFKNTETMRVKDWSIGLQSLLVCIEQSLVAIWFQWSFSVKEYRQFHRESPDKKMNIFRAALDALNCTDIFAGAIYAIRLLVSGVGPRGNGSWKSKDEDSYEPMKAPSDVHLHGVTAYHGPSASSASDDMENSNFLRPDNAEYQATMGYGYSAPPYPPPGHSRTHSPNGGYEGVEQYREVSNNPYRGNNNPYGGNGYPDPSQTDDRAPQVPASSLGRPQDHDQYYNNSRS